MELQKNFFPSPRGLRKGDPLTIMPFVTVTEGLSGLLRRAKEVGLFHGFIVENSSTEVTHLLFANDTLIFSYTSVDQINVLNGILRWFEIVLGPKINYNKCEMIGVRVLDDNISILASMFGRSIGHFPSTHLGMPLCIGMPKRSLWDPVI